MTTSLTTQFLIASECMNITSAMRKSPRWAGSSIVTILSAPSDSSMGAYETQLAKTEKLEDDTPEQSENHSGDPPTEELSSTTLDDKKDVSITRVAESDTSSVTPSTIDGEKADDLADGDSIPSLNPENKLIVGLTSLRANFINQKTEYIDVSAICNPFLDVIKSSLVSGHITSLALTSLQKFFELGVIKPDSEGIQKCLKKVVHALTHCRFEGNDRQEDDSVLLQLMDLLSHIVCGPCGPILSEISIKEIITTCLSMAMQMKWKDTLRQSVISTLLSTTRTIFANLERTSMKNSALDTLTTFVNISDPSQPIYTNNLRITILNAIGACFEIGGSVIGEDEMFQPVIQTLWKYLAQLIRVTTHPKLLKASLQLVALIMNSAPRLYKTQFEFVLVYLLTSLTPLNDLPRDESTDDMFYAGVPNRAKCVKSAPVEPGSNILAIPTAAVSKTPEIREVMFESLSTMAVSSPSFFPDLFLTYDCDFEYPDICEDLVGFLCRNAYPDSAAWSSANVPPLCLEAVLSGLSSWVKYKGFTTSDKKIRSQIDDKLKHKSRKGIETEVADIFNNSPSKGVKEMVKHHLIKSDSPEDLAKFLFNCKRLNKAVLGKYFAKSENSEIFGAYLRHIDFTGLRLDEALRIMLLHFRLPGEAGQIDNLMIKFAERYIAAGDKPEKDTEGAHVLAYAVLMLNTDHYSPTVKRKMDYEAFRKNVKLVSVDVSDEYVRAIYDGITTKELIMPEEHDTDETFEISWRANVDNATRTDPYYTLSNSDFEVVKSMFNMNWRPIVSTLSFVFATATDDLVFRRVISGFHQLATLAARYQSKEALNHVIACLSEISVLTSGDLKFNNTNIEIRIEDHIKIVVSDLSTQFGSDLKAQMASITLFRILQVAASEISEQAMELVSKALTNLYIYGLYKPEALANVKPINLFHSFERSKAGKPVGILSALSNYLTSSPDTPSEPSDESVDSALSAYDCIKACKIDSTMSNLMKASSNAFAQGALNVFPTEDTPEYTPAKEFLLNLAAYAAGNSSSLKKTIAKKALTAGLIPTALSIADEDFKREIMDSIKHVDNDTLAVLLTCKPSTNLWRLLAEVSQPPSAETLSYIATNVDSASSSEENLTNAIKAIRGPGDTTIKEPFDNDDLLISTLEILAKKNRNSSHYSEILGVLAELCSRGSAETRESALSSLQREFLLDDQKITWAVAATDVIIPHVLEVLIQPKVWKKDPSGMDLTRQQVASFIGKVFLHLTVSLNAKETREDIDAWVAVLKMLDRFLTSRRQPALQESIEEMLKNVIFVTKLSSRGSEYFWTSTENELKGFLPDIAALVFKDPEEKQKPVSDKVEVPPSDGNPEKSS